MQTNFIHHSDISVLLLNLPGTSTYEENVQNYSFIEVLKYCHVRNSEYRTIPLENLRLLYIASHLESLQIPHYIIDACIEELSMYEVFEKIQKIKPQIICLPHSRYITQANIYYSDIRYFFSNFNLDWSCHVTLEGVFPSQNGELILETTNVDSIITGNGEIILPIIYNAIFQGKSLADVPDCLWRRNGEIIKNNNTLRTEPFTFTYYPTRRYIKKIVNQGFTPVIRSGYGCKYLCKYCLFGSYYRNYFCNERKRRNVFNVCDEIEKLISDFNISRIAFADEIFYDSSNEDKKWILNFCKQLKKRNIKITFSIDLRIEDCEEVILKSLKEVGLRHVFLGIENISKYILKKYERGSTLSKMIDVLSLLHKLKISLLPGMILFDQDTTINDLRINIEFLKKLDYYSLYRYTSKLHVYECSKISKDYTNPLKSPVIGWTFKNTETKKVFKEFSWFFGNAIDIYKSLFYIHNTMIPDNISRTCIEIHHSFIKETINNIQLKRDKIKQLQLRERVMNDLNYLLKYLKE